MNLIDNLISLDNGCVLLSEVDVVVREYVAREGLYHAVIFVDIYPYQSIQIEQLVDYQCIIKESLDNVRVELNLCLLFFLIDLS